MDFGLLVCLCPSAHYLGHTVTHSPTAVDHPRKQRADLSPSLLPYGILPTLPVEVMHDTTPSAEGSPKK
jgi:hypothetical protein